MPELRSFDYLGPVVNEREASFVATVDPLGYRQDFRYQFTHTVFDAFSVTSRASVVHSGWTVREGVEFSEEGNPLGSSRARATSEALRFLGNIREPLHGLSVWVVSSLSCSLAFFDERAEPVFAGALMAFRVPHWWKEQDPFGPRSEQRTFTIWRDGETTDEGRQLEEAINHLKAQDVAGARRRGALR